ncbi:hypothetical protein [Tsuneonella sp. SYSU-LHT278]|uniref:hypothetical protein n=1 Tax=Tsuneonella sediminis TaxID=3416089 RepID=UPI003F794D3D
MTIKRSLIALAPLALLGACSTTSPTGMLEDQNLGEAKAATMAAQIIDPAPVYEFLDPATSGQHAAEAVERYRTDTVKRPERVSSTSRTSGGGRGPQ